MHLWDFFFWVFDGVADCDFEHAGFGSGDGHGVGEGCSSFGLVVDFPLHDVGSAGCAFLGFVGMELDGYFFADGDIDGPEGFVVALVVECDGEGFEGGGDVGECVVGLHVAAGGVGDELLEASCHDGGHEEGSEEHCGHDER